MPLGRRRFPEGNLTNHPVGERIQVGKASMESRSPDVPDGYQGSLAKTRRRQSLFDNARNKSVLRALIGVAFPGSSVWSERLAPSRA
jgi:hypothetical protein